MSTTHVTISTTTTRDVDPDLVPPTLVRGFLSRDLKTGPVHPSSNRPSDSVRNATWMPSGPDGTCAGASLYCYNPDGTLVCYSRRLELGRPTLGTIAAERLRIWTALGLADRTNLAAAIMRETHRQQTQPSPTSVHNGHPVRYPSLRLGAGGDLDTETTGEAWAQATVWAHHNLPNLRIWAYTRSYHLDGQADPAAPLARLTRAREGINLGLYLSTDPSMTERTCAALQTSTYGHLPVAILARTTAEGLAILDYLPTPTDNPRAIVCPVDDGRLGLTVSRRGTTHYEGACQRCRACIPLGYKSLVARPHVIFLQR